MKCKSLGFSLLRICLGISWLFWGMAFLYLLRISSVVLPVHKVFGLSSNGYTHLENYLNELAGDPDPGNPYAAPIPREP